VCGGERGGYVVGGVGDVCVCLCVVCVSGVSECRSEDMTPFDAYDEDNVNQSRIHLGSCFQLFRAPLPWYRAEESCRQWGGHLVSFASYTEIQMISQARILKRLLHSHCISQRELHSHCKTFVKDSCIILKESCIILKESCSVAIRQLYSHRI